MDYIKIAFGMVYLSAGVFAFIFEVLPTPGLRVLSSFACGGCIAFGMEYIKQGAQE
jgi:hypothetical protein